MYAKIENNTVVEYPIHSIHQRFPNISFPEPMSAEALPEGYVRVCMDHKQPEHDAKSQKVVQGQPELVDGEWVCSYKVQELDETELQELVERMKSNTKAQRDQLLRENVDRMNPMRWESLTEAQKVLWATYRQALLDITKQAGYPLDIVWPEVPK